MKCPKCNEEITHAEITEYNDDHHATPAKMKFNVATNVVERKLRDHSIKGQNQKGISAYSHEWKDENAHYGFYWHTDEDETEFNIEQHPPIPE